MNLKISSEGKINIPLARPDITEAEIEAVVAVLRTPHLALGPKLKEFENAIAEYAGVCHAVAANSGTSALHLIMRALGIGDGDEVITTPFSFISSSNCILFERAEPVFVDIEPRTLNIDPEWIEAAITPRTKAILAVDVFGHPADWDELERIANKHGLKLIEDSAEALGAEYNSRELRVRSRESKTLDQRTENKFQWRKAGSFGNAGVFAFYPNKQITTGEGGVIVTDDAELACLCRSMANQGRGLLCGIAEDGNTPQGAEAIADFGSRNADWENRCTKKKTQGESDGWLQHERLGYGYRLSDINCALGIAQLERIDEILAKRERVAGMYNERLEEIDGVETPYVAPNVRISWFVYVVRLTDPYTREDRDHTLQCLRETGIGCSNYFQPIHLQPFYRERYGYKESGFPITEGISSRTIALPFHNNLTEEEVDYVVSNLEDILKNYR